MNLMMFPHTSTKNGAAAREWCYLNIFYLIFISVLLNSLVDIMKQMR